MVRVGPVSLYSLGLAIGLGFLIAGAVGRPMAARYGLHATSWWQSVVATMIVSVVGARLVYVAAAWEQFAGHLERVWRFPIDGLSFYGGFFVGIAYLAWLALRRGVNFWSTADVYALPYAVGLLVAGLLWNTPVQAPTVPAWLNVSMDLAYVSGLYAVLALGWIRRRALGRGQLLAFVVLGDALLRLVVGTLPVMAVNGVGATGLTDLARLITLGVASFFYWALGGRLGRPDQSADPSRRPLARSTGWLVAYCFLILLMIVTRVD